MLFHDSGYLPVLRKNKPCTSLFLALSRNLQPLPVLLQILRHFEASCGQQLPTLRPCAQPNSAAAPVGPADLLTSPVPAPGSQLFLQPLSSATVVPRSPVPTPFPNTSPPSALEEPSEVRLVCCSEQGTESEQRLEKTDTPEDSSSPLPWSPNSLFAGMELVACSRLPCPSSQDLQADLQTVTTEAPVSEPSAFAFLNM